MALETDKFDYVYGKLLHLGFGPNHAKQLAKNLYDISKELGTNIDQILKYVTPNGLRFDNTVYASLNRARTKSSQIGFLDVSNIPPGIRQQVA